MTKRELINQLETLPIGDDANVKIWDVERDAHVSDGESPSTSMYDFEVGILNDDLSDDEKEYCREIIGIEPEPFIAISFNNPDYEDEES